MTEEETKNLKAMLTSEMVSRVTLAEAINIMHNLAVQEVEANVEKMSDEEKNSAFEELTSKVEAAKAENSESKTE
jgi:hypothetical protein|tara:strand:- start:167 stop:391 length:225 start_codon:yes stop_codon:yes gene_type:complete